MESDSRNGAAAPLALVTGASSGLGAEFARQLAARGHDLILTARREDRLRDLAAEIAALGRRAEVVALDLAAPGAARALFEGTGGAERPVDVLVNNAGFGQFGQFLPKDMEEEERLLRLNVVAPVQLTRLYGAGMARRRRGHILQVASLAAFQPTPWYAVYGASKAFLLSFGEAIGHELARKGVTVTVLAPGVTETDFFDTAGQGFKARRGRSAMTADAVVAIGLRALFAGRGSVIAGRRNAAIAFAERFLPRSWVLRLSGRVNKGSM